MFAKVITEDNRGYYSTVFGSFGDGWYRFLITYDDAKDCFDAVYMPLQVKLLQLVPAPLR